MAGEETPIYVQSAQHRRLEHLTNHYLETKAHFRAVLGSNGCAGSQERNLQPPDHAGIRTSVCTCSSNMTITNHDKSIETSWARICPQNKSELTGHIIGWFEKTRSRRHRAAPHKHIGLYRPKQISVLGGAEPKKAERGKYRAQKAHRAQPRIQPRYCIK
jgi:hypothetical protein